MKKILAPLVAATILASLAACSTPDVERVAATEPKPASTVAVTAQPKPAPTVTKTVEVPVEVKVPVEVPVPGPTVTVTAAPAAPAPSVPDFKPGAHPATLPNPYGGAPIPFPTVPAGMHFEEDDTVAYPEWVEWRKAAKRPAADFKTYRAEYVGIFEDEKYEAMQAKGYALIPLEDGAFLAFKKVGR